MDRYDGYNEIAIALGDLHKTAFTTPRGTFIWVAVPFKLYNAHATFQQLVIYIFTDLLFKSITVLSRPFVKIVGGHEN